MSEETTKLKNSSAMAEKSHKSDHAAAAIKFLCYVIAVLFCGLTFVRILQLEQRVSRLEVEIEAVRRKYEPHHESSVRLMVWLMVA